MQRLANEGSVERCAGNPALLQGTRAVATVGSRTADLPVGGFDSGMSGSFGARGLDSLLSCKVDSLGTSKSLPSAMESATISIVLPVCMSLEAGKLNSCLYV